MCGVVQTTVWETGAEDRRGLSIRPAVGAVMCAGQDGTDMQLFLHMCGVCVSTGYRNIGQKSME